MIGVRLKHLPFVVTVAMVVRGEVHEQDDAVSRRQRSNIHNTPAVGEGPVFCPPERTTITDGLTRFYN